MSSSTALQSEPASILACTVARDVQKFDLLIEDMEAELGEAWGDLNFQDARAFFTQPEAQSLEFVAIAIDEGDEVNLAMIADLIDTANIRRGDFLQVLCGRRAGAFWCWRGCQLQVHRKVFGFVVGEGVFACIGQYVKFA